MSKAPITDEVARDGFAIVPGILAEHLIDPLLEQIASLTGGAVLQRRSGGIFGGRNLLSVCPLVRDIAGDRNVLALVHAILGSMARPIRAIYFDKSPAANWAVAWHQDRTIAVTKRLDVDGYGPWSVKSGIPHVEPPTTILDAMLTIRLHLDDCGIEDGPLMVIPGSHRLGRLDSNMAGQIGATAGATICSVPRGGALLMRPLLVHASRKAAKPAHRRVLSLDYCAVGLDGGLEWHNAWS